MYKRKTENNKLKKKTNARKRMRKWVRWNKKKVRSVDYKNFESESRNWFFCMCNVIWSVLVVSRETTHISYISCHLGGIQDPGICRKEIELFWKYCGRKQVMGGNKKLQNRLVMYQSQAGDVKVLECEIVSELLFIVALLKRNQNICTK